MSRPHRAAPPRFDPDRLAGLDEPVRRYFEHALTAGGPVATGVRLTMTGRIDVGRRLDFTAEQEFRGHAFEWRARAGWGRFKPLRVVDAYAGGGGSTEGKLFGRVRFMHADDVNTARAAAGRAAAEGIWVPGALLPSRVTVGWWYGTPRYKPFFEATILNAEPLPSDSEPPPNR